MKLVRFGSPGKEQPGLIDDAGKLRVQNAHMRTVIFTVVKIVS